MSTLIAFPVVVESMSIKRACCVVFASASILNVDPSKVRLASEVIVPSPSSVSNWLLEPSTPAP